MSPPPDLLAMLRALFREDVRAVVREELGRGDPDTYTSARLPPNTTSRRFRELAPRIAGAVKRGRVWIVPVRAWNEYRTRRRGVARTVEASAATADLDRQADELLAASGLRVVRGGAR